MTRRERILGAVLGHAVGDALGVPVEFKSRDTLKAHPVRGMLEYGTHNQPAGTWSDDTSLMLCLLEHLRPDLDLDALARSFVRWADEGHMTPYGVVFDIGGTTARAIERLRRGVPPDQAGRDGERDNGNGSLMRILPIAFLEQLDDREAVEMAHKISCLTHRHPRSQLACGLFVLMCRRLLEGWGKVEAYGQAVEVGMAPYDNWVPYDGELDHYRGFLKGTLAEAPEEEIRPNLSPIPFWPQ